MRFDKQFYKLKLCIITAMITDIKEKPKIGISACLLGDKVRYDGGAKYHKLLSELVEPYVEYTKVCPEVAAGMGIPRPAIHLQKVAQEIRLLDTKEISTDWTQAIQDSSQKIISTLPDDLSGFVFKAKSPSCGMAKVPVYPAQKNSNPNHNGIGFFAKAFMKNYPLIPTEEEGRLTDAKLRENFFERVYALYRWQQLKFETPVELINFHASYKFSLMARGSQCPYGLGRIVAIVTKENLATIKKQYIQNFMQVMKIVATREKHINVMQHIMGYFKKDLDAQDKQILLKAFKSYQNNETPLSTPIALLNYFQEKINQPYIKQQYYLNPYPASLALRANI